MELKPCPFCGGHATLNMCATHECWIECDNGCVMMPRSDNEYFTSEDVAIKAWNTRKEGT